MVASCYRKTGSYQQALQHYKSIHQRFPENVDCLRFLVRLTSDLGLKEAQDYALLLKKAEKASENKRQRELSSSSYRSGGSAGSRGTGRGGGGGGGGKGGRNQTQGHSLLSGDTDESRVDSGGNRRPLRAVDASYTDPLGEIPQRPMTAARARPAEEDEFEGVELGDDLLPE
ncbi:Intraflagellar transport protein 88 homolog [Geodia barretti]|nr:Intraflagellar transport protein 88 homolog [Geodia barretti]